MLPAGLVRSWNHLCWLFTINFCATCARPRVDGDLANIVQKKGESLWEYIQHFCNKMNVIPEVDDKSIVMFFKKGLRDSSLIRSINMVEWPHFHKSTRPGWVDLKASWIAFAFSTPRESTRPMIVTNSKVL
jgi:hypothetical protein